jgi:hypothetical protein
MKKDQHVVKHPNGWAVKGSGNEKATIVVNTQKQAIDIGRTISRNQGSELVVHGRDGKIRLKDSHGDDQFPPRG